MTVPAYHLRPNKAIDRFAFMEAIRHLARLNDEGLGGYTYYGLGGPYLEDFRLLYELYPKIHMVSIEKEPKTLERQKFHRPCSSLQLKRVHLSDFITSYNPGNAKSIFWLDYNSLQPNCFTDFKNILERMAPNSMVKITFPVNIDKLFLDKDRQRSSKLINKFHRKFDYFMPDGIETLPRNPKNFVGLMQDTIKNVAEKALFGVDDDKRFTPVSSFWYSDGTWILTMTGVVYRKGMEGELKKVFKDWEHVNLTWKPPKLINMPILSTKERLCLQPILPIDNPGKALHHILGHSIVKSSKKTEEMLEQYATFHRYAPYFLKGIP